MAGSPVMLCWIDAARSDLSRFQAHHCGSSRIYRTGIGTALLRDLMEWAKRSPEVRKIELLVRATNQRAVHFYSTLGFFEEGRFQKRICLPDGNFIDDLAMAWFPEPAHDQP